MTTHFNHRTVVDHPAGRTGERTRVVPPRTRQPGPGRRWVKPVAVGVGAVVTIGVGALLVDSFTEPTQDGPTEFTDYGVAQRLVEESIADALAETSSAQLPSHLQDLEARVAADQAGVVREDFTTAQRLIDQSIESALAANETGALREDFTTARRLIEQSIESALAANETGALREDFTTAQRLIEQSIESALAGQSERESSPAAQRALPGRPDGFWHADQNATSYSPACPVTGPC